MSFAEWSFKLDENKKIDLADSRELANRAVMVLLEKKALDVKLFDVKDNSGITDYYVNATGRSSTQVASLADEVDEKISELGRTPLRVEGRAGREWLLVDFGDVIVNVFDRNARDFYNLDRHLPEGSELDISDLVAEVDKKFDLNQN